MLIGLGYRKRAGKDSAARIMVESHGFRSMAFAGSLKEAARVIFGFTEAQLHGNEKETVDPFWGVTPRHLLQVLGTEVVRGIRPDVWVRSLERKLEKIPEWLPVVITDVRYPNEAEAVRMRGGVVVRVDRSGLASSDLHTSETALDGFAFDHVLDNNGTLADLALRVEELINRIKAGGKS